MRLKITAYDDLHRCLGYVEDGSQTSVTIARHPMRQRRKSMTTSALTTIAAILGLAFYVYLFAFLTTVL